MRLVALLLRGFIFFTLFAFALNNQQSVSVHWFFGAQWHAPMVIVVLVSFAGGCAVGVMAMMPAWWRRRSGPAAPAATTAADAAAGDTAVAAETPKHGL
jgi:lipopolysaccharide assembly protein A